MVFKKLSKKIMAYTLTTAMALGFFAVSDINLTTAWAAASAVSDAGALTIGDDDVTIGDDIIVDGSTEECDSADLASGILAGDKTYKSVTFAAGTTHKLVVPVGKKITIYKSAGTVDAFTLTSDTKKITTSSGKTVVINGPADITKDGITFGTNGNITSNDSGNVVLGANITNGTVTGATITGGTVTKTTLDGCTFGAATTALDGAVLTGTTTVGGSSVLSGTAKGDSLKLVGQISSSSTAVITMNGTSSIEPTTANVNLNPLTIKLGSDLTELTVKAAAVVASGASVNMFKVATADLDSFAAAMKAGKVVFTSYTGQTLPTQFCAHLQNDEDGTPYYTYGQYDFEYAKSGREVTVTVKAMGNKNDKTSFKVNVKNSVGYGVANTYSGSEYVAVPLTDKMYAVDLSQLPEKLDNGVKARFMAICKNTVNDASGSSGVAVLNKTGNTQFAAGDYRGAESETINWTIDPVDIRNAKINELAKYQETAVTFNDTTSVVSDGSHTLANKLPKGFISIETATDTTSGSSATFTPENNKTTFTTTEASLLCTGKWVLIWKNDNDELNALTLTSGTNYTAATASATAGEHTFTISGKGIFTGTVSVPYTVADAVGSATYDGTAKTVSLTGVSSAEYYVNGEWVSDAPTYTDAGTYAVTYRLSDSVSKVGSFTIKPAKVAPVWKGGSASSSYTYDGKVKTARISDITNIVAGTLSNTVLSKFDENAVSYTYTKDNKAVDSCVDAGTYHVTATLGNANKNFKLNNPLATITINAATIDATKIAKDAVIYKGTNQSLDALTLDAPEGSYVVKYSLDNSEFSTDIPVLTSKDAGNYKVYFKITQPQDPYTGTLNVTIPEYNATPISGNFNVTVKEALSMKRTDSTKSTETYTGKAFPITADAYSGTSKESDVKVVFYVDNGNDKYTKITDGIKAVGTYPIVYAFEKDGKALTGKKYMGTITIKAAPKKSIAKATTSVKNVTYNANKQTAKVTVKYGKTTLKLGTDYTLKNATHINAGSFKVTITGKGNYTGTKTVTFKIAKRKVTKGVVTVKRNKKTYTVYVKIGKKNYKAAKTNYKLTSKYNKKTKKYAVTVAFKVNYSGTVKKTVK